jgi:CxxC-x17-CxxC domain-containing protein
MGNYNRDDRGNRSGGFGGNSYGGGGNRSGGGSRGGFRGDREAPMMHSAVCDRCGKDCEVPFKPTGEKPVYCRDCFRSMDSTGQGNERRFSERKPDFGNRSDSKPSNNSGEIKELANQISALNAKLDKVLAAIAPKSEKSESKAVEAKAPVAAMEVAKAEKPKKAKAEAKPKKAAAKKKVAKAE